MRTVFALTSVVAVLGIVACGEPTDENSALPLDPYEEAAQWGACPQGSWACDVYSPYYAPNGTYGKKTAVTGCTNSAELDGVFDCGYQHARITRGDCLTTRPFAWDFNYHSSQNLVNLSCSQGAWNTRSAPYDDCYWKWVAYPAGATHCAWYTTYEPAYRRNAMFMRDDTDCTGTTVCRNDFN